MNWHIAIPQASWTKDRLANLADEVPVEFRPDWPTRTKQDLIDFLNEARQRFYDTPKSTRLPAKKTEGNLSASEVNAWLATLPETPPI